MQFHDVDVKTQFKKMRELVPEAYRAFLEFDQKAFKDGAIPAKTKELIALGIAQITQCPWCIDAHTKKAAVAGASDAEIAETTFVAMAMAAGAAWSHGGLGPPVLAGTQGMIGRATRVDRASGATSIYHSPTFGGPGLKYSINAIRVAIRESRPYSSGPAAVELAQAAEAAGFDSIWTVEHVVVPHGYQSRYRTRTRGAWARGSRTFRSRIR
jgi:AhpD family alkylhydroperoxidase